MAKGNELRQVKLARAYIQVGENLRAAHILESCTSAMAVFIRGFAVYMVWISSLASILYFDSVLRMVKEFARRGGRNADRK